MKIHFPPKKKAKGKEKKMEGIKLKTFESTKKVYSFTNSPLTFY